MPRAPRLTIGWAMRSSLMIGLAGLALLGVSGCSDESNVVRAEVDVDVPPSGEGCVVDFYSATAFDNTGYYRTPLAGDRCELNDGSLNPLTTGGFFKEYLNGRCVEFMVMNPSTVGILGYC